MPFISISEAAKLTGKDRRTIERHLKNGLLSCTTDVAHKRVIEISELMRVFGELSHNVAPSNVVQMYDMPQSNVAQNDGEKIALKAHIQTLEHQLDERTKEARELRAQVTGLLEYRKPEALEAVQKQIDWWMILGIGSISAILIVLAYFFSHGYRLWFML
jgi:hypothetical protein